MSMISELVEKLRNMAGSEGFYDDRFPSEKAKIIKMAADTIEELSTKLHNSQTERPNQYYNGGWILCSERLPEENTRVLTTIKINKRPANVRSGYYAYKMFHNDNGDCWNCDDKEVIAWMQLPKPHKERED